MKLAGAMQPICLPAGFNGARMKLAGAMQVISSRLLGLCVCETLQVQ
jgi:hypothetical protein